MYHNGFFDLNVPSDGKDIENIIQEWYTYKYRTIAINQIVDLSEILPKKKKKGDKQELILPEPFKCKIPPELTKKINVLNRITIKVSDVSQFLKVFQCKPSPLKKYHIIAVATEDQQCFQQAINMNEVDLISIDCKIKPQWRLTRKNYNIVLEQNKYFEICYSPTIRDASTLNTTIFLSHLLYTLRKSKNVILSSETSDKFFLRTPYEVIFLFGRSHIFGLNENKARNCVTTEPLNLVNRAMKRRMGKSNFLVKACS